MTSLHKEIIVERIMRNTPYTHDEAKYLLETLLEVIKSRLEKGDYVRITNFGKWSVVVKKPRRGRNPTTGESMMLDQRRVVNFHPAMSLRNSVNATPAPQLDSYEMG